MVAMTRNINPDEIAAGDTDGFVAFAPKGTAAPVDPVATYATPWADLGIIADDGINTAYKRDSNEKMGWNVRGVVKRIPKAAGFTFKFTALQTSADMHTIYYGSAPTALTTAGQTRTDLLANSDVTEYEYGIDLPFTDGTLERYICPRGVVTDLDDIKYTEADVKQFGVTVGAQISPGVDYLAYILSDFAGLA